MKQVVYLLVAINIAYFGWNMFVVSPGAGESQAIAPAPDGVKPLVLLSEQQPEGAALDAADIDALTQTQPPAAIRTGTCKALGPFTLRDEVDAVLARLAGQGLQAVERATQSRVENGYWVYLPKMDRQASRSIAARLRDRGDNDFYVGKDYFIALGTYRVIEQAEQRRDEVARYGLEPVIEPRFRTVDSWWLELPADAASAGGLAALLADRPQLELHTLSCR